MTTFKALFGMEPEVTASAPGRVNLLGEHTDYQGGFVLPTAIPQQITVEISRNGTREHVLHSESSNTTLRVPVGQKGESFAPYVIGCLELSGINEGLNVLISGKVPSGGLSSSAALEVATLRALRQLFDLDLNDVDLALRGVQVEHQYAGVKCGVMDQMASSLADTSKMLLIDTRSLERRVVPFPAGAEVLVIDSGVPRRLAESGYNERRAQVEEAARVLGVKELRDVQDISVVETLDSPLRERARHVVSENQRVQEGLQADAARFGELMNASHASLQGDYAVSHPQVDELVSLLQAHPDVFGARITGAGFGGAVVALVKQGTAGQVAQDVLKQYPQGKQLVPESQ